MEDSSLDSLLQTAGSADIDSIMSQIRAQVERNAREAAATAPEEQAEPPRPTVATGDALKAQAHFNHELMSTLKLLADEWVALRGDLAQLRLDQQAAADRDRTIQESLASAHRSSSKLEQEMAEFEREVKSELESSTRQRHEQVRLTAQLEERIRQVDSVLGATGKRLDRVASRTYETEKTLEQFRERIEDSLLRGAELQAHVSRVDTHTLELEKQFSRTLDEVQQQWEEQLSKRDLHYGNQSEMLRAALADTRARVMHELSASREHLESEVHAMQKLVAAQAECNEALGRQGSGLAEQMGTLERKVDALDSRGTNAEEQFNHRFDALTMRLLRAERAAPHAADASRAPAAAESAAAGNAAFPFDYFMFAHQHRGSVASVRARQVDYADLFRGRQRVLDLGCGRGEFLELAAEHGLNAIGVDADPDMIDFGRERGLNVVRGDLFAYLQAQPAACLDGIFTAQVIEHMAPDQIRRLIGLCRQKLARDGLLVLETVNPLCPRALSNFWLDPTHVRPVPPKLLTFLLDEAGFCVKSLWFKSPIEGSMALQSLETLDSPAEVDQYQDYAAIASVH